MNYHVRHTYVLNEIKSIQQRPSRSASNSNGQEAPILQRNRIAVFTTARHMYLP